MRVSEGFSSRLVRKGCIPDYQVDMFIDDTWKMILPLSHFYFSEIFRDDRTVIFCDPDPVLNFENSVQVQPLSMKFKKLQIQVHMKSKKLI